MQFSFSPLFESMKRLAEVYEGRICWQSGNCESATSSSDEFFFHQLFERLMQLHAPHLHEDDSQHRREQRQRSSESLR
jgi:hypothetical protein